MGDVLIFFSGECRALHVPVLLSLGSVSVSVFVVTSASEADPLRAALMSVLALALVLFTLSQYRLLSAAPPSFDVRTVLGRRALPLERVALGVSESRSQHGLPIYAVHAEAEGQRISLTESVSRQRAEKLLRRLHGWLPVADLPMRP